MFIARSSWRAALLLAACALPAAAQAQSGAADAQAAVPATVYKPSIGYRPEAASGTTPDQNWAQNNATVAATNSMSLTMKGMHGMQGAADPHAGPHSGHAMPAAPAATPASRPANDTPPPGHHPHHQESR